MPLYYCVIYSAMWPLVTCSIALKILYSLISVSNTPFSYCMYTRIIPELHTSSDILDRSSGSAILHPVPILIENYVNQQGQQVNRGEYCSYSLCVVKLYRDYKISNSRSSLKIRFYVQTKICKLCPNSFLLNFITVCF